MKIIKVKESGLFNERVFEKTCRSGSTCPNCQCASCANCNVCHCIPSEDVSKFIKSAYLQSV